MEQHLTITTLQYFFHTNNFLPVPNASLQVVGSFLLTPSELLQYNLKDTAVNHIWGF